MFILTGEHFLYVMWVVNQAYIPTPNTCPSLYMTLEMTLPL